MDIGIPDKTYKLLVWIGVIIVGYSEVKYSDEVKNWKKEFDGLTTLRDSLNLKQISKELEFTAFEDSVKSFGEMAEKTNSKREIKMLIDSLKILNGNLNLYKQYDIISYEKNKQFTRKFEVLEEDYSRIIESHRSLQFIGLLFFLGGLVNWTIDESRLSKIVIKQNEKLYLFCQSCGKRFSSILRYGTNKNGTSNYSFCKECYKKGKFTKPHLTKMEFLENIKNENSDKNWFSKKILISKLENLERWIDDKY